MPTYEFRCPRGHEFEKFYRTIGGAEAQAACPECGTLAERMMSPAGFAFKGSGFYLTDYGKNAHREKGAAAPAAAGETAATDGAKAETKSDAAAPSKSETPAAGGEGGKAKAAPAEPKTTAPSPPKKSSDE